MYMYKFQLSRSHLSIEEVLGLELSLVVPAAVECERLVGQEGAVPGRDEELLGGGEALAVRNPVYSTSHLFTFCNLFTFFLFDYQMWKVIQHCESSQRTQAHACWFEMKSTRKSFFEAGHSK